MVQAIVKQYAENDCNITHAIHFILPNHTNEIKVGKYKVLLICYDETRDISIGLGE